MLLLVLACTRPSPGLDSAPSGGDSERLAVDSAGAQDSGHVDDGCEAVTEPSVEPSIPARELVSDVTWTLEFDETAEASGLEDCSYRRTYAGTQFLDQDYLCPDCDWMTAGQATMQDGEDCFAQISSSGPDRPEWWGVSETAIFRTTGDNYRLGQVTDVAVEWDGDDAAFSWGSTSELSGGGVMVLTAVGTLSASVGETLLPDPWAPRQTPYAGGWPQDDPGTLELDYDLEIGSTFPNARMEDQCGDAVDLWDLHGRWLIVDTSQPDCGPCQAMARDFGAFQAELAAEGIDVVMASYMGVSLSDPLQPADPETIDLWVETYGNHGPVFRDRGFVYAVLDDDLQEITGEDGFGWPAWVLVDPEMKVVDGFIGYGGYDDIGVTIRAAN